MDRTACPHRRMKHFITLFLIVFLSQSTPRLFAQGDRAQGDPAKGENFDVSAPLKVAIDPANKYYVFIENNALMVKNWDGPVTWVHSSQTDEFVVEDFNNGKYSFTEQSFDDGKNRKLIDLPAGLKIDKIKSAPLDVSKIDSIKKGTVAGARTAFEHSREGKDFAWAQFFIGNFPRFVDHGTYKFPDAKGKDGFSSVSADQIAALTLTVAKASGDHLDPKVMVITKEDIEDGAKTEKNKTTGKKEIVAAAWKYLGMLHCDRIKEDPSDNEDGSWLNNAAGTEWCDKGWKGSKAHFDCGVFTNVCYGVSDTYDLPPADTSGGPKVIIGLARAHTSADPETDMEPPVEIARFAVPYAALNQPGRLTVVSSFGKPTVVLVFIGLAVK